jgi:hypothetical protein
MITVIVNVVNAGNNKAITAHKEFDDKLIIAGL